MKTYIKLLSPIISVTLIFVILFFAQKADFYQKTTYDGKYLLISLILTTLVGCVITLDFWVCKNPIGKTKLFLLIERIVIVILIFLLFSSFILPYNRNTGGIWALIVGYECTTAILHIIPDKKQGYISMNYR